MSEALSLPPVPEPDGYLCAMGFVKSRPENNQHYMDLWKDDPWYAIITRINDNLTQLVPGYNISQLKDKFGQLRYYISQGNCPDETWAEWKSEAYRMASVSDLASSWFDRGRKYEKEKNA